MTTQKITELPEKLIKQIIMELIGFTDEKNPQIMSIWEGERVYFFSASSSKSFYASVEACEKTADPVYMQLDPENLSITKKSCGDTKRNVAVLIKEKEICLRFEDGSTVNIGQEGFPTLYDPISLLAKMRDTCSNPDFSFILNVLSGKSRDTHVAVWAKDNALHGQAYLRYEYLPGHQVMKSAKDVAGFTVEAYATTRRKPQ